MLSGLNEFAPPRELNRWVALLTRDVVVAEDSFVIQPITNTIICPSCGETLLFGVNQCRFCQSTIDEAYADRNARAQGLITNAVKSANIIRAFRNLLYFMLAMTVLAFIQHSPYLEILPLISAGNLIGPIRWLRKYRGVSDHPDVVRAAKHMRIELYLWLGALVAQAIALLVWLLNR